MSHDHFPTNHPTLFTIGGGRRASLENDRYKLYRARGTLLQTFISTPAPRKWVHRSYFGRFILPSHSTPAHPPPRYLPFPSFCQGIPNHNQNRSGAVPMALPTFYKSEAEDVRSCLGYTGIRRLQRWPHRVPTFARLFSRHP